MKSLCILFPLALLTLFCGCRKTDTPAAVIINIPNGDFENWTSQEPDSWVTNSCPFCLPAYETYIVQQSPDFYQGQYCAKLLYNNVYPAQATNKFALSDHPASLHAFVKTSIIASDTVSIDISLLKNSVPVDGGHWVQTNSISSFSEISIPITQNSSSLDSVVIKIRGGNKNAAQTTVLWIDHMYFEK